MRKKIKRFIKRFKKLSVSNKIQFLAALVVSLMLLIATPVVAWFGYQRHIIKMQKVQTPNSLYLSAAHREDSIHFNVSGIDAEELVRDGYGEPISPERKITHKDYVFCVTGKSVDKFTIQLAYTTNNPFEYQIWAADEVLPGEVVRTHNAEFEYVEYQLTGDGVVGMPEVSGTEYHTDQQPPNKLYYKIDTAMSDGGKASNGHYIGDFKNLTNDSSGSHQTALSTGAYHTLSYGVYSAIHSDAEPVYWQATGVSAFPGRSNPNKDSFSRHFILRVRWNAGELDNIAKETDIVYITVKATK